MKKAACSACNPVTQNVKKKKKKKHSGQGSRLIIFTASPGIFLSKIDFFFFNRTLTIANSVSLPQFILKGQQVTLLLL